MNIKEKIMLLTGKGAWCTRPNENGFFAILNDGPVGHRFQVVDENFQEVKTSKDFYLHKATVAFPSTSILASTWNKNAAYIQGQAIANQCIQDNVSMILGPGVNIKRHPYCGRNFEYYSEDPFLAGNLAKLYIEGVQSEHVGACLKHYACNNAEFNRLDLSSDVDERTLREIYLKQFEIALEAKPYGLMCSYNTLNNLPVYKNKWLFDIARNEFKYDCLIVSDWGAVKDIPNSIKAGMNLIMPEVDMTPLFEALESGEIAEADINNSYRYVEEFINKCEEDKKLRVLHMNIDKQLEVAKEIADEGIVLLKNNGVLPLQNGQSISIIGDYANRYICGGGSAEVPFDSIPEFPTLDDKSSIKKFRNIEYCLKSILDKSEIITLESYNYAKGGNAYPFIYSKDKDVAIVTIGTRDSEGFDRCFEPYEKQLYFIDEVRKVAKNVVVILLAGSSLEIESWKDKADAIIFAGYPGCMGNESIADILTGKVNPSGRLSETFAKKFSYHPSTNSYHDVYRHIYEEKLNIGYRYFDKHPELVSYPFGYGLSYSSFIYSDLKLDVKDKKILVQFKLLNDSDIDGKEVAQIYVGELNPTVERPIKELKGFEKVSLKAHESKTVVVELNLKDLAFYDLESSSWKVNNGEYQIYINKNALENVLIGSVII